MANKEMGEKQIFMVTIVVFAAILLIVGGLIFLSYSRLSRVKRDIAEYKAKYQEAERIAGNLQKRQREKKDIQERVAECNQYLPMDDDVERTLLSLTEKGKEAGFKSNTLKKEADQAAQRRTGQAKQRYETIRYAAEFEGTFHQLAKFVSAVEDWKSFKRFVSITSFSVEADSKGLAFDDEGQKHKTKMTLELYKYVEPPPPPPAPVVPGVKPAGATR